MSTTNGYAAFLRNRDMAKIIADTNMSEAEKYAYYEANYGTKAPKYTAATTPEMPYADYLKRTGMNGATQKQYDATVRTAEADYAKGKATYGQTGETLAQRGLTGSGYGDYLTGASFAAMQNAKVAAADTKALADAEIARGYGEYLTGVQQANAIAQANADNANAESQAAADAANKLGYANYINDYNLAVEDAQKTIADYMAQGYKNREIVDMMRSKYGDTFNEQLGEWIGAAQKSKKLAEEEQKAADTANIKTKIADYIAQGIDDNGIAYRIQLQYGNAYDGSLSQWINESRTALQGDAETVNTEKQNRVNETFMSYVTGENAVSGESARIQMRSQGYTEEEINNAISHYSSILKAETTANILNATELSSVPTNLQIDAIVNNGWISKEDAALLKNEAQTKRFSLLEKQFKDIGKMDAETAATAYSTWKASVDNLSPEDLPDAERGRLYGMLADGQISQSFESNRPLSEILNEIEGMNAKIIGESAVEGYVNEVVSTMDVAYVSELSRDGDFTLRINLGEDEDGKIHGQTINPSMKVFNSKKNEEIAKKLGDSKNAGTVKEVDGKLYISSRNGRWYEVRGFWADSVGGKDNIDVMYDILVKYYTEK